MTRQKCDERRLKTKIACKFTRTESVAGPSGPSALRCSAALLCSGPGGGCPFWGPLDRDTLARAILQAVYEEALVAFLSSHGASDER